MRELKRSILVATSIRMRVTLAASDLDRDVFVWQPLHRRRQWSGRKGSCIL